MRLTYDVEAKKSQNLMTTKGLLRALQRTLRLCEAGLLWCGVPCKSFSWMSSSKHGRTAETPFGRTMYDFVATGNTLTSRSIILCIIAMVRGCTWFIEQPGGSTMAHFPYLMFLMQLNFKLGTYIDVLKLRWF